MRAFIKVQTGSIIGNAIDFLITIVCTEILSLWYLLSGVIGNVTGGLTQFAIGRRWIFPEAKTDLRIQFFKYILFFVGNILLSAAGTYALAQYLHLNYIVAKLTCSVLLGISYNYYVQKYFVFT